MTEVSRPNSWKVSVTQMHKRPRIYSMPANHKVIALFVLDKIFDPLLRIANRFALGCLPCPGPLENSLSDLSCQNVDSNALNVWKCYAEAVAKLHMVEAEIIKRDINRDDETALTKRAVPDKAVKSLLTAETESVEGVDDSRCFHVYLTAHTGKGEGRLH